MTTVLDIVKDALQESGVLTQTEDPSNSEAQTGLKMLNRLVSSWSNNAILQFERVTEEFALTNLGITYTIGSGGDFDTTRPTKIVEAHVQQNNVSYSLEIVPDAIYQSVVYKTIGGLPEMLNYTNEYPLGTINIYPAPSGTYTLFITSEKPLTSYSSLASTVDLPPGWEDALIYNVGVRLASIYGQPVDPRFEALAKQSRASISMNALRNNPLQSQPSVRRTNNNIYSGYYT